MLKRAGEHVGGGGERAQVVGVEFGGPHHLAGAGEQRALHGFPLALRVVDGQAPLLLQGRKGGIEKKR